MQMDAIMKAIEAGLKEINHGHKTLCGALAMLRSIDNNTLSVDDRLANRSLWNQVLGSCDHLRQAMEHLPGETREQELPPLRTAASMLRKHREGVVATSARHGRPILVAISCLLLCALPMTGNASDVRDVAWTLWAEARGEGAKGLQAVATVIANRSAERGLSPAQVVHQPYQFECWNGRRFAGMGSGPTWAQCRNLAARICDGTFQASEEWNHFFNPRKASPRWALAMNDRTRIGGHVFGTIN